MVPAAIASIAAPIIGGLFGGKKEQKAEYVVPDYSKIRKQAEAAGYNPETALMAAGGGGVAMTGGGSNWADALAAGLNGYAQYDMEQQRLDLEKTNLDQRAKELELRERQFGQSQPQSLEITPNAKVVGAGQQLSGSGAFGITPRSETDSIWEPSENRPAQALPLTTEIRTGRKGDRPWRGLNPDGWDIDLWELAGGLLVHGGEWALNTALNAVPEIRRMNDGSSVTTRHGHKVPMPDTPSGIVERRFPNLGSQYW